MTETYLPTTIPHSYQDPPLTEHLINRCLSGEQNAYVEVYNLYAASIYRLCYSLLQHKEDAEEVLQDAFEYAFRRLELYDATRSGLKTWLFQIAVSRCRNKRRRKWLPTVPISQLLRDRLVDRNALPPDESLDLGERQQLVWEALGQLSPKLRETAVLRYYEDLTYAEIGQILSIPPKTAESRMRLAHRALAQLLEEELGLNRSGEDDAS